MTALVNEIKYLIREGVNERAKAILEANPYAYHLDKTLEYTFLHNCAIENNENMAQYLLDNGCLINSQDPLGRTPLMLAVQNRQFKVGKLLLSAGADTHTLLNNRLNILHSTFSAECTPYHFLVELLTKIRKHFTTSEEMTEKLMSLGCHLYQAVCSKDVRVIQYLLDHGHSANSMYTVNKLSALHVAVCYECVEIVKLLLNNGACATALDNGGRTPLFCLYLHNRKNNLEKLEIMNIFLHSEIFVKSCNDINGIFQIIKILIQGNREAVRLVFQAYSKFPEKEEGSGKTMLHYVAQNKNPGVVEELKLHIEKFNVNALDKRGRNPLYWASRTGNIDTVQFLLEQGASVNSVRYVTDFPPLYHAYSNIKSNFQSVRLIELLLQHDADAQFIFTSKSNRKITIFDVETKGNSFYRMKFIIAHLAMLKQQGTPITKSTWSKIKSTPSLKKYFNKCRQVLQAEIYGRVTIFKLLISDYKKLASYLNQEELNLKLNRIGYKHQLKYFFPYYYSRLRKRLLKARSYKILKDNAAKIFCKIFYKISNKSISKSDLIVGQVTSYLDDEDLQQLLEV